MARFRIKHCYEINRNLLCTCERKCCLFDTHKSDPLTKIIRRIIRRGSDIRFHKVDFSMKSTTKQVGIQTARYLEDGPTHTLWNRAVESLGESREWGYRCICLNSQWKKKKKEFQIPQYKSASVIKDIVSRNHPFHQRIGTLGSVGCSSKKIVYRQITALVASSNRELETRNLSSEWPDIIELLRKRVVIKKVTDDAQS